MASTHVLFSIASWILEGTSTVETLVVKVECLGDNLRYDTIFFLDRVEASFKNLLIVLGLFCSASGLKINMRKHNFGVRSRRGRRFLYGGVGGL